jgi:hypothetical protein
MKGFDFGIALFLLVIMLNVGGGLIYLNVLRAVFRPKDDPGILIWWLCCIRIGSRGENAQKSKTKNQSVIDKKTNKSKSIRATELSSKASFLSTKHQRNTFS